jgi:hypothetical protein
MVTALGDKYAPFNVDIGRFIGRIVTGHHLAKREWQTRTKMESVQGIVGRPAVYW